MRFVRALASALIGNGGLLETRQPGRKLFDEAVGILRVYRKGKESVLRQKDVWSHLSYGNLVTGLFTVLKLVASDSTVWGEGRDEICLRGDTCEGVNFWDLFFGIDVSRDYDAELWRTSDALTLTARWKPSVFSSASIYLEILLVRKVF